MRSTADLTPALVAEFDRTCDGLAESSRGVAMRYLRIAFNHAVEWGCLKRNPCDKYAIPKPIRAVAAASGDDPLPIDIDQARELLAYLKARSGTWDGLRFYTLISILIYK